VTRLPVAEGVRKVVLDTNFLLIPFHFKINIVSELDYLIDRSHQYVVSSRSMEELSHIAEQKGKSGMGARLAIKMVQASPQTFTIIPSEQEVDDWIVSYSRSERAIVCTNDSPLRRRLKAEKIPVISLKGKSSLGYV
jgi:rRNA-processing protein FCF1